HDAEGPRDAVAEGARLGGDAAAVQLGLHVVLVVRLRDHERLLHEHLQRLVAAEELVEAVLVQEELAGAGLEVDARDGGLPLPGRVELAGGRAQRSLLLTLTGSGFCAWWGCRSPAYTFSLWNMARPSRVLGSMPRTASSTRRTGFFRLRSPAL